MGTKAILFDLYGTLVSRQERHFLKQVSNYHIRQLRRGKTVAQLGSRVLEIKQKLMRTDLSTHALPSELLALFALSPDEHADEIEREFRAELLAESYATTLLSGTKTILSFFKRRGYASGSPATRRFQHSRENLHPMSWIFESQRALRYASQWRGVGGSL